MATYNTHEDALRLLLDKGADVEAREKNDWTPFTWAVLFGLKTTLELLESTKNR